MPEALEILEAENWNVFLAIRMENPAIDARLDHYNFFAGPFSPAPIITISVATDSLFTKNLLSTGHLFEAVAIMAKPGVRLRSGFSPDDYGAQVKVAAVAAQGGFEE